MPKFLDLRFSLILVHDLEISILRDFCLKSEFCPTSSCQCLALEIGQLPPIIDIMMEVLKPWSNLLKKSEYHLLKFLIYMCCPLSWGPRTSSWKAWYIFFIFSSLFVLAMFFKHHAWHSFSMCMRDH
jgi:hypothetical protein